MPQPMRYQKYPPSPELKPFIECYFVWEGEAKEPLDVQTPPNGYSGMVFNYADPYRSYQNSPIHDVVPLTFVSGPSTSNFHLVLQGKIGMVGVVLRPSSVHNFFGLRMSHLVNSRMPLNLLIGEEADHLMACIKSQPNDEDRVKIADSFFRGRLKDAKSRLSVIDEAVELIDAQGGNATVDEVAAKLKISRRYLEKKFLEKVGISPKFYARLKRFSILSNRISHQQKVDWQDVVFESGLHDQSHLVKEFIEFNKMNPSSYHENHREMTRFVNKLT